jgi:beta-fructofuranosidase
MRMKNLNPKTIKGLTGYSMVILLFFLTGLHALQAQEGPGDNRSIVPQYTFPTNLDDQIEALKTNPLLLRFKESRKKMSGDPHRPIYHYVNPEGRLNDPNGLCFWQGNWHLFYQAYPPEFPRQHWGHAVSKDLIHWEDLPLAIYPGPERACFSGSAYVDDDRVIAFYHGTEAGSMAAVSSDPLLLNWEKVSGRAVIPISDPSGFPLPYSVYDPCIWKRDSVYYALLAGRINEGPGGKPVPTAYLFRSLDLEHWQYLHPFVDDDRFTLIGDDYACPYFWPIGDRYILPFYSHMSGGQYLLGDYDTGRNKFVVTNHGNFNFGPSGPSGVHAPSAAPDGIGGVIIIFNMNPGMATEGWDQIMSLPRRLSLISEDEIGMEPAGDIESLRYNHEHLDAMILPANKEIKLKNIRGNALEIYAEIDAKDASMVEVNLLQSPHKEEFTTITLLPGRGYRAGRNYWRVPGEQPAKTGVPGLVSLQTARSSVLPGAYSRAPETAQVIIGQEETLKLRIFVDKSIVEVFVNGKQCVAARVYPGRDDSVGVSLRSQGSSSQLVSLDAWKMKNIYEDE